VVEIENNRISKVMVERIQTKEAEWN
jgi:hypothetical protein